MPQKNWFWPQKGPFLALESSIIIEPVDEFFWNLAKWCPVWVPMSVPKRKKSPEGTKIWLRKTNNVHLRKCPPHQSWTLTHFVSFVPHYTPLNAKNNNGYNFLLCWWVGGSFGCNLVISPLSYAIFYMGKSGTGDAYFAIWPILVNFGCKI